MFRTASGGDDFDGMAPATVTDTPPSVATQTDQAFDTAPKLPDTSVSPNMIGAETPYGQRAIADYENSKTRKLPDGTIETLTARELFIKTGVYKGKDGKYRVEIPVEDAELTTFNNANLYGVIDENG